MPMGAEGLHLEQIKTGRNPRNFNYCSTALWSPKAWSLQARHGGQLCTPKPLELPSSLLLSTSPSSSQGIRVQVPTA